MLIMNPIQMNDVTNKRELCMAEKDVQRNHKDTVFNDLFSDKRNALYNALNGTNYEETDSLDMLNINNDGNRNLPE